MKFLHASSIALTALLLSLSVANTAPAQQIKRQVSPEIAAQVKERKLVVLLKSADGSVAKKLNGAELKNYKQGISAFNDDLQAVIKTFWSFNSTITYLTSDKITSLAPVDEYAILAVDLINVRFSDQLTRKPANQILRLNVCMLEYYNPLQPVFYQDIVGYVSAQGVPAISKMDLIAATHMVQNHFQARLEDKSRRNGGFYEEALEHPGILQNKVLLIDSTFMDSKLKEADIKQNYAYQYEISNPSTIEKAQMARDKRYAYVYVFPVGDADNTMTHCILDCETGKAISYSIQSGFHNNNYIDQKHLEQYVLYSDYYNNKKGKGKKEM